jgi:hypothetical protein
MQLLTEANKRGLLTGKKKAQYDEAVRRGLIESPSPVDLGGQPPGAGFDNSMAMTAADRSISEHRAARAPIIAERSEQTPERQMLESSIRHGFKEALPAIGATVATLPFGGWGGRLPQAAALTRGTLVPSFVEASKKMLSHPLNWAFGATRAGVGAGFGSALAGNDAEQIKQDAFFGAVADPFARITLGLGKLFLRPATRAGAEQARRIAEFARRENLHIDVGQVTDRIIPQFITNMTKNFFGSRLQSRKKMQAIVNHISADPLNVNAFFKKIFDAMPLEKLAAINTATAGVVSRVASKVASTKSEAAQTVMLAAGKTAGEAAEILFTHPAALALFRREATKKEFGDLTQAHLQNMIQRSATQVGDDARLVIDGDLLIQQIKSTRPALEKYYPKQLIDRLENFAVYVKAHRPIAVQLSDAPMITPQSTLINAMLGGGAITDPTGVSAGVIALSTAFASHIFNSRSPISKWLTTGLMPKGWGKRFSAEAAANFAVREDLSQRAESTLGTLDEVQNRFDRARARL